jgi:calmodulin
MKIKQSFNLLTWKTLGSILVTQFVFILGSGELEFEEFCMLSSRFLVEEDAEAMQQELREAFRLYDKEGNGYITTDVLREILRELDDKITAEELDMMIEEIDSDGSGTVDFDGKLLNI